MCEFKVLLEGEKIMGGVISAKVDVREVTPRDIIGEARVFKNIGIVEVKVPAQRLVLSKE